METALTQPCGVGEIIAKLKVERDILKGGLMTMDRMIEFISSLDRQAQASPPEDSPWFTGARAASSSLTQVIKANLDPVGANKPVEKKPVRKKRGKFPETGEQMILGRLSKFTTQTTGQLNTAWVGDGRKGKADNAIGRLVKAKKIKRVKDGSIRGSRYVLA